MPVVRMQQGEIVVKGRSENLSLLQVNFCKPRQSESKPIPLQVKRLSTLGDVSLPVILASVSVYTHPTRPWSSLQICAVVTECQNRQTPSDSSNLLEAVLSPRF